MKRRIILLGAQSTGKSALAQQILGKDYTDEFTPTKAFDAEIAEKIFPNFNSSGYDLQIWDMGGSAKLKGVVGSPTVFNKDSNHFCIVFDPSNLAESISEAKYWLTEIKDKCGKNVRIQFVVTKCDLKDSVDAIAYTDGSTQGQAAITAYLQDISTKFNHEYKQKHNKDKNAPDPILPDIIFCSAKDPTIGTNPFDIITNFFIEENQENDNGIEEEDKDNFSANQPKPWSAQKFYSWGKNFLMIGVLLTIGFILTSVFQSGLSADVFNGMNLGFFVGIAASMCAALGMFITAAVHKFALGDPGENKHKYSHHHPIQLCIKAVVVATFVGVLIGVIAGSDLVLPVISPVLQATMDTFSQINFPGLQAALPGGLAATFAIMFLAAVSYFVVDTLFRIYNSRWDNHTAGSLPLTSSSKLAWLFNLEHDGTDKDNDNDNNDIITSLLTSGKRSLFDKVSGCFNNQPAANNDNNDAASVYDAGTTSENGNNYNVTP